MIIGIIEFLRMNVLFEQYTYVVFVVYNGIEQYNQHYDKYCLDIG